MIFSNCNPNFRKLKIHNKFFKIYVLNSCEIKLYILRDFYAYI